MPRQTGPSPDRTVSTRQRFLESGAHVFVREGYVGASMELVARDAGLSRAALYKHFTNKEELFLSVAEMLHESAAAASAERAASALSSNDAGADLIIEYMLARRQRLRELLKASAHATELLEESSRRCGPVIRRHGERFRSELTALIETLADADRLRLRPDMSAATLADMLLAAETGLKSGDAHFLTPDYEIAFARMARTLLAGAARH